MKPHAYARRSGTNYCANRDCGKGMGAAVHAFSEEGRIGDVADYLAKTFDISESAACAHAAHLATLWA